MIKGNDESHVSKILFFFSQHDLFFCITILPFHNTSAPARLRMPVPHVSTKPLKSSLSLHAKILIFTSETSELSTATGIIMK